MIIFEREPHGSVGLRLIYIFNQITNDVTSHEAQNAIKTIINANCQCRI